MKKLQYAQSILLLIGTVFAWYNTILDILRFYHLEGTLWKFTDCAIPNPLIQPCFYGAIAFGVAFTWSVIILRDVSFSRAKQQCYLSWLLVSGTIFAWGNVTREFIKYYGNDPASAVSCSGLPITNPFLTSCFTGAIIFLLSAIVALVLNHRLHSGSFLSVCFQKIRRIFQ